MAYLTSRSIAFGSYVRPRQAQRRQVRFAGHYGLGALTAPQCNIVASRLMPALRAKYLQACLAQVPPTPPPAPAPVATPIVAPIIPSPIVEPGPPPPMQPFSPQGAIPGTPVPIGYPTNQIFVDSNGDQWMYQSSSGTWIDATQAAKNAAIASEQAQAAQIAAATATSPQGGPAPILVTSPTVSPYLPQQPGGVSVSVAPSSSGYSDILNWLSESTLISPVPNWVLIAGGAFLAFKMSKGKLL